MMWGKFCEMYVFKWRGSDDQGGSVQMCDVKYAIGNFADNVDLTMERPWSSGYAPGKDLQD